MAALVVYVHVLGGGGGCGRAVRGLLAFLFSDSAVCERSQASQISVSHSYFSGRSWCVAHLVWRGCLFIDSVACMRSSVSCLHWGGKGELLSSTLTYCRYLQCLVTISGILFIYVFVDLFF